MKYSITVVQHTFLCGACVKIIGSISIKDNTDRQLNNNHIIYVLVHLGLYVILVGQLKQIIPNTTHFTFVRAKLNFLYHSLHICDHF